MTVPVHRFIIVVLDSVGIGAMPDAGRYGDDGADTLGNIRKALGADFKLPHLATLGLGRLVPGLGDASIVTGAYGRMACASPAKDTTAGHWELAGLKLQRPFPTYPHGFPRELIETFENKIGTRILGNRTASGTKIIAELGGEHIRTGFPIVYTSADSVFQVAAHEDAFGLERLYEVCRTARELLTGEHAVGRVIARPFIGNPGAFTRTANRRDFSLEPPAPTLLDAVSSSGGEVIAVGKIEDIFAGRGITRSVHTRDNNDGMDQILSLVSNPSSAPRSLLFANLVDFDMLWGHRRDARSYAAGLQAFDAYLPSLRKALRDDDVLIITADHGCDPTFTRHTDHTREYVPLLVSGKSIRPSVDLGTRSSFADVARTIADVFGLKAAGQGTSFWNEAAQAVADRRMP